MLRTTESNKNLGTVPAQVTNKYDISLVNSSDKSIKFSMKASCGCTVPVFPKDRIEGRGTLKGYFNYKPGRGKGSTHKSITFSWTDPIRQKKEQFVFHFNANVI